jgi:hypothetical protein
MNAPFTTDELRMLRDLVESRIDEMGSEIHHCSTREYREDLKVLREKLRRLDERLSGVESECAAV